MKSRKDITLSMGDFRDANLMAGDNRPTPNLEIELPAERIISPTESHSSLPPLIPADSDEIAVKSNVASQAFDLAGQESDPEVLPLTLLAPICNMAPKALEEQAAPEPITFARSWWSWIR